MDTLIDAPVAPTEGYKAVQAALAYYSDKDTVSTRTVLSEVRNTISPSQESDEVLLKILVSIATTRQIGVVFDNKR